MSEARPKPDLEGRIAMVTGGARRLGRACAVALACRGARVVLHYHRSRTEAEEACAEIERLGGWARSVAGDLRDARAAEQVFADAVAAAGPPDILVNSASVYEDTRLESLTPAAVHASVDLHALAPFVLARCLAVRGRAGVVINLLDARVGRAETRFVAYHLGKQMLAQITRMMAVALAPAVRVNGIAPGAVLPPAGAEPEYLDRLARANLLGRTGAPADVVRALLYLVAADFVTGEIMYVDGGHHLRGGGDERCGAGPYSD